MGHKVSPRQKFIALKSHTRKEVKSQINNVSSHLKNLNNKNKTCPKQAEEGNDKDKSRNQCN